MSLNRDQSPELHTAPGIAAALLAQRAAAAGLDIVAGDVRHEETPTDLPEEDDTDTMGDRLRTARGLLLGGGICLAAWGIFGIVWWAFF